MKPLVKPIVMEQEKRTNDTKLNWIVPYRICTAVLSITTISLSMMQGITNPEWDMGKGDVFNFFNGFAYFTIQSNILVFLWWVMAILSRNKEDSMKRIEGKMRGGVLLYITITFAIFALLLSGAYTPTLPVAKFTNISLHYILPIMFILDWIITEKIRYSWGYIKFWLIYPSLYLIFALIYYNTTDVILYFFIDYKTLGIGWFIIYVLGVVLTFILFSALIVFITRKRFKEIN